MASKHKQSDRTGKLLPGPCSSGGTFDKIGGFDEDLFIFAEDNDFALRIRQAGWKIFYLPNVSGVHVNETSTKQD